MAKLLSSSTLGSPPDTYFFSLAQTASGTCLATIGSDDTLRVFDYALHPITTKHIRSSGLTCLQPFHSTAFATTGRDGCVRIWESRAPSQAQQVLLISEPQQPQQGDSRRGFSALACRDHFVAVGTESSNRDAALGNVSVLLFDTRMPSTGPLLRNYAESHTDDITSLAFHPEQPNILISGSTDGLISLFDLNQTDEEDALQQVLNPRSAVHSAGFLSQDQAYVLTTDEQLLIYPLQGPHEDTESVAQSLPTIDFGDVRPTLDCMYMIDLLQESNGQALLACGHNENQKLSLVQLLGDGGTWKFGEVIQLPGAHGEEVIRDVMLFDGSGQGQGHRVYGCGEDGTVRVWGWP